MKRLFKILLAAAIFNFQFSIFNSAQAQFAGPDKKVAREPGNTQKVEIGTPDPANDICYIWTGPHIDGNSNQAVITVNPHDSVETYQVKRISKNGIEEDEVKVRVEDSIAIVAVYPKYDCYNHGEAITTKQFEIITEPAGYEHLVTVSPTTAKNNFGISIESVPITFTLDHNGHTSKKVVTRPVFNSDLTIAQNIGSLGTVKRALESLALVDFIIEHIEEFSDFVPKTPVTPCKWKNEKPKGSASMAMDITPKMLCCSDHHSAPALQVKFGQVSYGAQYNCRFPFSGIPYIASADVVCGIAGSVALGPVDIIISTNDSCDQACIPLTISVSVNGGVGASFCGDVLNVDLVLQGTVYSSATWCPVGSSTGLKVGLTISVVGSVTLAGFIEHSIEFPMATYSMFIPF